MNDQYLNIESPERSETEKLILDRASRLQVPDGKTAGEALAMLKTRIAERGNNSPRLKKRDLKLVFWTASVAAALLVLITIWQVWSHSTLISVIAERGSHLEYRLPDGSRVFLNADSRISFSGRSFMKKRHLTLDGEGFFEIARGSTFTISTPNGDIQILGTSFNVFARDNSFTVSCLTGKILVSALGQTVTITPGETSMLSGESLVSYKNEDVKLSAKWIDGEFVFENSPVGKVFNEIERQFNIKFAPYRIKDKFFTGSFSNKDLQAALEIICIPLDLNYEIGSNGEIFITENPE